MRLHAARLLPPADSGDTCPPVPCDFESMSGFVQLDLFGDRPDLDRPSAVVGRSPLPPNACPMTT